jgi:crotonobetainyl-CoA:carnitine CoA-transferase CaiB-like acyl-CoA transferase
LRDYDTGEDLVTLATKKWEPLKGIRVLDLTHVIAGPTATQLLADMGAEVIKVERPGTGDTARENAFLGPSMFVATNRNKKSVAIDLTKPAGQELLMRLAAESDVLVENMAPGDAEKFGIAYQRLIQTNPRLVYCSIESFGEGPYERLPAFDPTVEAMTGLMSVTGFPPDKYARVGSSVLDTVAGALASTAIIAALYGTESGHAGFRVKVSLGDVGLFATSYWLPYYKRYGKIPLPVGSGLQTHAPYQLFKTKNGRLYVTVTNDNQWKRFCEALGFADLLADERYKTTESRTKRKTDLEGELAARFASLDTRAAFKKLLAAKVPAGPFYTMKEVFEDPHFRQRGIFRECELDGEKWWVASSPINVERSPANAPPDKLPGLGEHTVDVLSTILGMTTKEIDFLRKEKIIGTSPGKPGMVQKA